MENSTNTGLQFFNATGTRQPKSVNDAVVIAESTRASFKLMPAICAVLGIQDGDYVTMQMTKDDSGVVNGVYIGKGKNATYELDENGNVKLDDRKRKVTAEGGEGFGALAAEQTAGSNVLKISVASAWDALGDTEVKKHYKLSAEPLSVQLPIGDGDFLSTELYKLEYLKDEEKVVRTPSKKKDGEAADDDSEGSEDNTGLEVESTGSEQADLGEGTINGGDLADNEEF